MIICLYMFVPLLFLPVDSSSIRDRSFKNDLVPSLISRLDPSKKDNSNSLKIVSNEPFIIQLQMPNSGESSTRRNSKDKDTKRKRPTKKRVSKIKPLRRHRQRRDLQTPGAEADKHRKSNPREIPEPEKAAEHQSKNATKNSISRVDVLKALSSFPKGREAPQGKKRVKAFRNVDENSGEKSEYDDDSASDGNIQRVSFSPFVKMVYPSAPKTEKRLHKYTYKDLISDRERLEKKIKYIRNMLNASAAEDIIRVRRRSESDRTANKIAKMFLTLSAVNGMHDKLKPKCDDDDDDDDDEDGGGYRVQDIWEKEREDSPSRKSSSSNEERYKVKKWIEHMKNKRSSSKSCPCMGKGHDEEGDVFPLEQKLPKNYYLFEKGGSSEESSEGYRDPLSFDRDKPSKNFKRRNLKGRDDHEKKLKGLGGKGRKLELPLDDLETYRMKAKQILQNAEEILDKIKEEEEKRVSMPNALLSQLKELTTRIQTDPRNNENDLIRKIQKNLGWGLTSPDGGDGSTFLENVKSFILDPYEKAKALTDESTKKLSSYLLRNLGELKESGEVKEQDKEGRDSNGNLGETVQEEKKKVDSIVEKGEEKLSRSKEDLENWADTVSLVLGGDEEKKSSGEQEDQFKKRMEDMMKEQGKKLNEFEVTEESEESSKEHSSGTGSRKEKQHETADDEGTLRGDAVAAPLGEKKDGVIVDGVSEEKEKREKMGEKKASKESDYVSGEEVVEGEHEKEEEAAKRVKEEEVEKEVLREMAKEFDEEEKNVEADYPRSENSKGEREESKGANEDDDPVKSVQEKSTGEEEVAAAAPEEKGTKPRGGKNRPIFGYITSLSAEAAQTGGESSEETLSGREELETKADTGKNSAEELNETPGVTPDSKETVGASDVIPNKGDELQEESEVSHREVEPQKVMEYADLIQEANEEKYLEKMKENEEEEEDEEKTEDNEALRQDDQSISGKEDGDDVQASKTGDRLDDSKESLEESEREGLGSLEKNFVEGSPLASATSEESSGEHNKHSDDEASVTNEKPPEEPADESVEFPKEANEGEGIQRSGEEGGAALKATMNGRSDERDATDATAGMETTSREVDEEVENAEGSSETLLKSIVEKSREEPDRYGEETSGKSAGPQGAGSEEEGESQDVNEGVEDKLLKSEKSSLGVEDGDSESVKGRGSSGMVSEEKIGEDSVEGEEEIGLKATGPTRVLDRENSYEDQVAEGEEKATEWGGQELTDLKNKTEDPSEHSVGTNERDNKNPNRDATVDETVRASLDEKDQENSGEDDAEETLQQAAGKSDEESKMVEKSLRNEGDEKSEEVEAVLDDRDTENGDADEESVKAKSDVNEDDDDDDEVSLKATLDDDDQVTRTEEVDDDAKKREDEGNDDENQMSSLDNEDPLKENTNETPLRAAKPDADAGNDKEENQDTSEGMADDVPLRANRNKEGDETPLKAAMEKDEETDETPLRAAINKDEENLDDNDETPSRAMEKDEETDETPLRATMEKDEENLDEADETPLKAAMEKDEENLDDADETPIRAAMEKDEENLDDAGETPLRADINKDGESDETLLKATMEKDEENMNEVDETPLRATMEKDEENLDDADETPLKSAMEKDEESDETPLKAAINKDEENLDDTDETPSRAMEKDEETDETPLRATMEKDEENLDEADETPLKAAMEKDEENLDDADETPIRAAMEKDEETDEIPPRAAMKKDEENLDDADETPLKSAMEKDEESLENDTHLRANINKNDEETLDDADETSLRKANINDDDDDDFEDKDETNSNEGGNGESAYAKNDITEGTEDGETLRAENPKMAHQASAGENPLRAASLEEFNNDIYDSDETPLRSKNDDLNDAEAAKEINEVDSEESLRGANTQDDVSNRTNGKNEDGTPLKSTKSFDGVRKKSKKENLSEESEDYSPVGAAGPVRQQTKSRGDRKEQIPSDSLKIHPLRNPIKAGKLKVPTSIGKIMKDLEGQEKDDITAIENLNPEKIDHIIDKIDEVEQQNKVTDEVDCRKECACAEDINTRSRNRGRYEIARDFLQWMKELQLNRVLSDD